MTEHFNKLTPAEAERFAILAEEANEVAQMCMKILRHGRMSYHPNDLCKVPNSRLITSEIADFLAVMRDMEKHGDFDRVTEGQIHQSMQKKRKFTHHQNGGAS